MPRGRLAELNEALLPFLGYLPAVPLKYIVQISILAFLLGGKPPLTASPAALVFPPRHLPFLRLRLKGMRSLKNPRKGHVLHVMGKIPASPLGRQIRHGGMAQLGGQNNWSPPQAGDRANFSPGAAWPLY